MGRSRFRPRSCRTFSQFRQSKQKAPEKTAALHDAGARSGQSLEMGRSRFRPRSCRTFSQFRQSKQKAPEKTGALQASTGHDASMSHCKTKAAEKTAALHDAGARSGHTLKWADQDSVRGRVVHLVNFGNRSKKRQKRQPHSTTLARGLDIP